MLTWPVRASLRELARTYSELKGQIEQRARQAFETWRTAELKTQAEGQGAQAPAYPGFSAWSLEWHSAWTSCVFSSV